MWFQRLVAVDEFRPEVSRSPAGMLSEESVATSSSSRTKGIQVPVVTPADFQRVRLMSALRKTIEREQIEGAYSGATENWTFADVLPEIGRTRLDGASSGFKAIAWQRDTEEVQRSSTVTNDVWTEISKDFIVREAIEELGYDYEENDYFYYILVYLRSVCISHPSGT
jgi:hypothetical protein